jgi:alkylation response protein AidB-like acyl-CoA dehydrogenase
MNFELTEEQVMFRDTARKFARQEMLPTLLMNVASEEQKQKYLPGICRGEPAFD